MTMGSHTVSEYGLKFKAIADQLTAIGRGVDETDKAHWFLRCLGPFFSAFSASQMAIKPFPNFLELLPRAESFALFLNSMDRGSAPAAAFSAQTAPHHHQTSHHPQSSSHGRGRGAPANRGRGRGR